LTEDYLQFRGIRKRFPGVLALDDISCGVAEGSVHALIGENGAGKSTLLKILSGVYRPDAGSLRIDGRACAFASPVDAIRAGVAVIYQELNLAGELSVAENLMLGHLPSRLGWVSKRRLLEAARRQLAVLEEDIDPNVKVGSLPIAQRQMVEIAKALMRNAKIIAFDEPTSSLSDREVSRLFAIVRDLRRRGCAIIYVSHRLEEVFDVSDSVTVLRDGRHVRTFDDMEGVDHDTLVRNMVGRSIADIYGYAPRERGGAALSVRGLTGGGLAEPAELSVARGEVVGLFGLVGAGRTELLKLLFGAIRPKGGRVEVLGRGVTIRKPADAIRQGVMFCPEDRKTEGIIPVRSVAENINISVRRTFCRLGLLINEPRERRNAARQVEQLGIRTPSLGQLIVNLSGGNQQKTVLARWLSERVRVLLLDEPTRGIDVGAKSEIYAIVYDLAARGVGLLIASSELPEVLGICDRILVMREGRIVARLSREQADEETVLRWALPGAVAAAGASGRGSPEGATP